MWSACLKVLWLQRFLLVEKWENPSDSECSMFCFQPIQCPRVRSIGFGVHCCLPQCLFWCCHWGRQCQWFSRSLKSLNSQRRMRSLAVLLNIPPENVLYYTRFSFWSIWRPIGKGLKLATNWRIDELNSVTSLQCKFASAANHEVKIPLQNQPLIETLWLTCDGRSVLSIFQQKL